ncbi:MAG: hypothetical protein AAFQ89_06530 [Cyanobacteria bacterium J06626_18]
MGITYAEIELVRVADQVLVQEGYLTVDQIRRVQVKAVVDAGLSMLVLPRAIANRLYLHKRDEPSTKVWHYRTPASALVDDPVMTADVVGPVAIRFQNSRTVTDAIVSDGETEVRLGRIAMHSMDVRVNLRQKQLVVNPKSPDISLMMLK